MSSIVAIVRCPSYDEDNTRSAVEKALSLAEIDNSFGHANRVLLKPNLLSIRRPDEAITTHPSVVKAIGEIARREECEISLGDSPPFAGENPAKYDRLCEITGMMDAARSIGAQLVRFEEQVEQVTNPNGRFYKSFDIAKAVLDTDILVNIPKLKTHGLTTYTGAVKNIFGCVPGIRKGLFHVQAAENREVFAQMLVDLLGVIRPSVNIMDAVIALEGEGPNAGSPREIGLILASSDPVALDAVACSIIGLDPMEIDTTRLAHEQGLGCGDLSQIEIRGETIEAVRVPDFRQSSGKNDWARIPAPVRRMLRNRLVAIPKVVSSECVGCGDCVNVCPVKAIMLGQPVSIDLTSCIRCYCCHEVCNLSAIRLQKGILARLFERKTGLQ